MTALSAFWTGLLYDSVSLEAAYELIEPWTREERDEMRREVPRLALMTPHDRSNLYDVAAQAVGIAGPGWCGGAAAMHRARTKPSTSPRWKRRSGWPNRRPSAGSTSSVGSGTGM